MSEARVYYEVIDLRSRPTLAEIVKQIEEKRKPRRPVVIGDDDGYC